jgi:adenine deaminase
VRNKTNETNRSTTFTVSANIVDVLNRSIFSGTVVVEHGRIARILPDAKGHDTYILPGFVDAHVHIESSMLVPSEFAKLAVVHGTVATVSDPHEIANVLGIAGVDYMIDNGKSVPFKFAFGASPCVPATTFETAGAALDEQAVDRLLQRNEIPYLSEMMNFPGVIAGDPVVMSKIGIAKRYGKPIDGHAPGLRGEALRAYVAAGISTDHETYQYDEGEEKLALGMKLLIREGSAAKNFDTLSPFIGRYPARCMFCSDDKHPDDLVAGHINDLAARAVRMGIEPLTVLQCASVNPVLHYGLDVGLLRVGDPADFIEVENLERFTVLRTFINGRLVAEHDRAFLDHLPSQCPNNFKAEKKDASQFQVKVRRGTMNVIEAIGGQVITGHTRLAPRIHDGSAVSDVERDVLKLAVVNRYGDFPPSLGFVKNFGLKKGAIASSVAHDSHNIVAVGVDDEDICRAVNLLVACKGGLSVVYDDGDAVLPLPVAGLMSNEEGLTVARTYSRLDHLAKQLGSFLGAPFMALSFMALLVIPKLKLSDKGLFDGEAFHFVDLFSGPRSP